MGKQALLLELISLQKHETQTPQKRSNKYFFRCNQQQHQRSIISFRRRLLRLSNRKSRTTLLSVIGKCYLYVQTVSKREAKSSFSQHNRCSALHQSTNEVNQAKQQEETSELYGRQKRSELNGAAARTEHISFAFNSVNDRLARIVT